MQLWSTRLTLSACQDSSPLAWTRWSQVKPPVECRYPVRKRGCNKGVVLYLSHHRESAHDGACTYISWQHHRCCFSASDLCLVLMHAIRVSGAVCARESLHCS
jgi:hypothetical protein